MTPNELVAGYTQYTDPSELTANSMEMQSSELASTPTTSSVPCADFTYTVTVAFTC